jgi:hypothetical protein
MQTSAGKGVDDQVLDRSELSLEHAAEAAVVVVLLHATHVEVEVPELRL